MPVKESKYLTVRKSVHESVKEAVYYQPGSQFLIGSEDNLGIC